MTISYNAKMKRYEVFGKRSVKRNGKLMPVFVCDTRKKAESYVERTGEK